MANLLLVDRRDQPIVHCFVLPVTILLIGISFLTSAVSAAAAGRHHHHHHRHGQGGAVSAEQQQSQEKQPQQHFFGIDATVLEGQPRHQQWRHNLRLLMLTMEQKQQQRNGFAKHRRGTVDLMELDDVERSAEGDDNERIEPENDNEKLIRSLGDVNDELIGVPSIFNDQLSSEDNGNNDLIGGTEDELIGQQQADLEDSRKMLATISTTTTQRQQKTMSQSLLLLVASCAVFVALALSLLCFCLFYYVSIIHRGGFACWATGSANGTANTDHYYYEGSGGASTTTTTMNNYAEIGGFHGHDKNGRPHPQYSSMSNSTTVMTLLGADETELATGTVAAATVATVGQQQNCTTTAKRKTVLIRNSSRGRGKKWRGTLMLRSKSSLWQ